MSSLSRIFRRFLTVACLMAGASLHAQSWTPNTTNSTMNCASPCSVGISTTTPSATLDVFGHARSSGASGYGEVFAGSWNSLTAFHLVAGPGLPLAFSANNGAPQAVLSTSGFLGVGTTGPQNRLHVWANPITGSGSYSGPVSATVITRIDNGYDDQGAGDATPFTPLLLTCRIGGGGDSAKCGMQLSTAGNSGIGTRLLTALRNNGTGASSFYLQNFDGTAWQNRFVVDPAGNVGVGVTSPTNPLHITANPSGGSGLFSGSPVSTVVARIENTYDDAANGDTSPFTPLLVSCRASGGGDTAKCGLHLTTAGNTGIGTRLLTALRNNGTGASSFYLQNYDGAAWQTRMVVDPAGNVGVGTTTPAQRLSVAGTIESTSGGFKFPDGTVQTSAVNNTPLQLTVSGAIQGNQHLGFMPWANGTNVEAYGYLKLVTPIADHESNLFSLHIYGYRYQVPEVEAIDIRCNGYAYTQDGLTRTACTAIGTDLPLEITTEPSNGTNYVVVRIGTASTYWYYPHFSVEYDGWQPKSPSAFVWKVESTIPAGQTPGNMNNVAIANNDGGSVTIGHIANDLTTRLTVNGAITANSVIGAVYQDVAEWVPATIPMDPGTVVVLNPDAHNEVMPSSRSYDMTVAGVVSAQPGLLLGRAGSGKAQIATTGRVKVHVDATRHPVHVGDLLVTADKPGMAMVSEAVDLGGVKIHRPGTLLGKALEPLTGGEGDVLVLLSLQ